MKGIKSNNFFKYLETFKSRDLVPIECPHCNTIFSKTKYYIQSKFGPSKNINNVYCSKKCSAEAKRKYTKLNCRNCGIEVIRKPSEVMESGNVFCSQSCAASHNNRKTPKRKAKPKTCRKCDKIVKKNRTFCTKCISVNVHLHKCKKLEDAKTDNTRKKILLRLRGHKCEDCLNTEWKNKPIPLELDHINGNNDDNSSENLRLICPNCHALTPTYKGKNKGKGRKHRMDRYYKDKLKKVA